MTYRMTKCACGDASCTAWHVSGVAQVQGVRFSAGQAAMIAQLLNDLEEEAQYSVYYDNPKLDTGDDETDPTVAGLLPLWSEKCSFEKALKNARRVAETYEVEGVSVALYREEAMVDPDDESVVDAFSESELELLSAVEMELIPREAWDSAAQKE